MPLDLEPLELEPVGSKLDLEPLDLEPVSDPRAARRADLQAQQAAARSAGETTSFSARAAAGIEQGLRTPEAMVRGGLDALQYYRALDAVTGSGDRFQRQNEAELRAMRDRDAFLARETQAIEGRDARNFVGDLVQGVARGVVELPPQLMAGAAGAMRGAAVQASAAMGGVQGGLSQYAQERGEGRSQLEALPPAVASGLITAVTTRAFGDTGIESVFRNEGTQGFRRRLLGVLKDAGMEGAEEFVDQAQQDLLERVTRNPGKPLGESFYDTMQALAVGTVIGGAATAPRLIQRGNRPVIVNEQTGTTDFPHLEGDELPAPPPPAPPAGPANVPPPIRGEAAMETRPSASWTPDGPRTPAVDPELADAIAAIRAGYNPEVDAPAPAPAPPSTFNLQPSALPDVPGVPPSLEGQPYDTALRTRPEATMETRPAAPLGLQREPTVSPELADAIAAVRGGYNPEVEAQPETSNVQRPTSKPASRKSASELAEEKAARQSLEASLAAEPAEEANAETQRRRAKQMADRVAQEWTTGYTFERNYPISEAKAGQVANALWTEIARMGGKPDDYTVLHDDWVGGQSKGARQRSRMWFAAKVLANLIEQSQSGQRQLESDQNSAKVQVLDLMAKLKAAPTAPAPKTPPDQSGGPTELTPPAKVEAQPETSNVQRPTSIPDLPTFVAQAIAKEMAPDVNVELVRRRFGAAEAAAAKSSKPTAAEAEMIARAKARAEQQGWAWSEVLRKVQQQLGLDADFLPEGGNDAIQLAAMRKQDALDAARAQRFDASLASLPTTPAPKTPPDQSGGPTELTPPAKAKAPKAAAPKAAAEDRPPGLDPLIQVGKQVMVMRSAKSRKLAKAKVHRITPDGITVYYYKDKTFETVPPLKVQPTNAATGVAAYHAQFKNLSDAERKSAKANARAFKDLIRNEGWRFGWYDPQVEMGATESKSQGILADEAFDRGLQKALAALRVEPDPDTPDVQLAKLLPRLRDYIEQNTPLGERQNLAWMQATAQPDANDVPVYGNALSIGQTLEVDGEPVKVTAIDPDTGMVTLEDGTKFGTQQLEDDAVIYVDKVNAPPAREAAVDDWDQAAAPDFALNEPESVEQQKARLAQEQAQRDAQAQRDKLAELQAKPLTGTTGDLGQGSLLDAPQDLFAPPSAVDSAIAALEAAKVKPGGLYALPDLGLTVTLWNGTLTAAQVALRAGRTLAQAVQAGVDWLRAQGQQFDEAEVRKALEQGLLQAPGIREHVGKRLLQEDFSPAAKAALEPLLRYEVKPDAQLFAEAAAVVEAIGPMEAEANYFGNPWGLPADAHVVLGFAIGNGLSTLEAQARAAGDTALADRIGRQNAEFQSQFVLQSTETARTLRAYRYFDLVGNLSPFTADLFARKVIERASQKQKQRIKPALDKGPDGEPGLTDRLNEINRAGIEEAARTPEVQGAARTAINQAIEEEAERKDTAVERAITLEVSNTLETLPSVVRKANAAVLGAWDKLSAGEQVRQQTGRAGQGLENSLWSAVKQRGGTVSTVSSVIAQVNRALHEQVNRALGITPQQFVNPTTYLMRLRDALGNAEIMSRIWEQTRAAVGANLAAIGEMEGLLLRIEAEIAELLAEAKTPLAGGPEVTAKDAKLKAQQQAARDEMLKGRNANLADAIKQRRDRIADVTAQLAEYRKMQPAWQAVMGMTVDVWGPNLLRGLLREQMKADGFRLRKAVADHFRGLAGAPDPLQSLGVLRDKLIAASGLDPQAAERLAKDLEAEYTAQVNKERARLAERLAKARELAKAKAAEREAKRPQLDAESLIDAYERRQTEWLKPTGRKSAVRAIVRQALREGAAVAGLNEQVVRGGVQAQLEAVGVPHEAAYRLAYEVWQERQAKGGGIDAVVAARVKELQLDLGRIIRQHWTQVDKAGESLAEHIVGETKMPAEQAERLAAAIQRRFKALVQARKEQALRNLAKTPAARELQKPSVAQRIIEATNLGALDSEGLWQAVADKLGLPTYSAEASAEVKRLADRAQQLPEGSVQRQEATARLMRFIARQKGVNLGDLGWAFWYANTLSGPITHAVNAFSNVLSLAGNVSTQFRDVRGIPQILAATAKGFRTGLTEARAIVKQGPGANRTKFTEQGQALENLDPQDFTGAGLVSQWRYVARALAAADAAFYFPAREAKAITLARALARQEGKTGAAIRTRAQQILDGTEEQQNLWGAQVDRELAQLVAMGEKPDALLTTRRLEQLREQGWGADIGEAADDFALRTTYNNRPYGLIGTLADVAKFAQNRVPGARGVVPFVNVVANVVNDSINYTPWGFARAYAAGRTGEPSVTLSLPFEWAEKLREGKSPMTPDAVVDLHAKAALGTAMVGSLMAMALAGLDDDDGENFQLYGSGPNDAAAKAALRETGWLPYSVRVNGTYVSFANTPLAIPLGALGHYLDAARYDKRFEQADAFNRLGVALWGGAHIITQQSFLDGLARLLGALEERRGRIDTASDRAVEQAFRSVSSVAVPNALRQLDRLNDPKIYDARGIEGALVAAIPFARRAGSPALNAFGEPITNEPWKRFASDAEANVWTDLARRKIYPSVADKAKNSNGREMTDDEHYRYVQESGQAIKRRLETPGMRQMIRSGKEEDARKAVTAIVREERERARRRLGF